MTATRRRVLALGALSATLLFPSVAFSQAPQRVYRVAVIGIGDLSKPPLVAFVEGLRAAGYEAGKNIEYFPPAPAGRGYKVVQDLAAAAVKNHVDVIFAFGDTATVAAKAATQSIPIVMLVNTDPVARGLVKNLARPEGNVTGVAGSSQGLVEKRFELLGELAPGMRKLGVIASSGSESQQLSLKAIQAAAARRAVRVEMVQIAKPDELNEALKTLAGKKVEGLIYTPSAMYDHRTPDIIRWAAEHKIPAVYAGSRWARAGGLMSYNSDTVEQLRRAANCGVRILKGAKPADLPVEHADKFELVINLKAAKAIGIGVPHSLLVRADEVIQ